MAFATAQIVSGQVGLATLPLNLKLNCYVYFA